MGFKLANEYVKEHNLEDDFLKKETGTEEGDGAADMDGSPVDDEEVLRQLESLAPKEKCIALIALSRMALWR